MRIAAGGDKPSFQGGSVPGVWNIRKNDPPGFGYAGGKRIYQNLTEEAPCGMWRQEGRSQDDYA